MQMLPVVRRHACPAIAFGIAMAMLGGASVWGQRQPRSHEELQFSLELIDAQAFGPNTHQGIDGDPSAEVAASWKRYGVLADGVSVVAVRLKPASYNGAVTFTLKGLNSHYPQNPEYTGSLSAAFPAIPAPDQGPGTGAMSVTVPAGSRKIVFYRPPASYFYEAGRDREELAIEAAPADGADQAEFDYAGQTFTLYRPTLLLNHGIFSGPATFAVLRHQIPAESVTLRDIDWSEYNASGFDDITPFLSNGAADEIARLRFQKIAAARLDLFGHSTGGVMLK
jgi:hypothetical protein